MGAERVRTVIIMMRDNIYSHALAAGAAQAKHEHDHVPRAAGRALWNNALEGHRVRIHEDPAVAHGADQRETRMQIETRTDLTSGSSPAKTAAEEVISQPAGSSACSRGASISSGKVQVAEALAHFRLFPFPLVPLPVAVGLLAGHGQLCRRQGIGWAD